MNSFLKLAASAFVATGLLVGCTSNSSTTQPSHAQVLGTTPILAADNPSILASIHDAIAVVHPLGDSKVMGTVTFTQTDVGVQVVAEFTGLTPGKHAFHIHEFGDCSDPKGMSAGGHYNPEKVAHGLPGAEHHHPGDMGNLEANAEGKAHLEIMLGGISIAGEKDPILGRSIIVHEKEDDGSQPTGNAGGRIACGVIGVAKSK